MKISDSVKLIIDNQQKKGIKKYGITVDDANLNSEMWIIHAQEEIADCLIYLESLKRKLSTKEVEINILSEAINEIKSVRNDMIFMNKNDTEIYKIGIDHACDILEIMMIDLKQ